MKAVLVGVSTSYDKYDLDYSLDELEPRIFSFNAPYGACPDCNGLGFKQKIDEDLIIPDKSKSIIDGGIVAYNMDASISFTQINTLAKYYNIPSGGQVSIPTDDVLSLLK